VVYGSYADRRSAQEALAGLPSAAAAYHPVLRTVNGIRTELKQHGKDF
jgi:septal ring-binding cell division protein DamX